MISKALLARFESRSGHDDDVRRLLADAGPLVAQEPGTLAWFGLRFGRGDYGIFDAFADEAGRDAHLNGAVARTLVGERDTLLAGAPAIDKLDVLAHKLPAEPLVDVAKGLLLTFKAKAGHAREVAAFLRDARAADGVLLAYLRHTSASLTIQENADPDVLRDLGDFFRRLVPEDAQRYRHVTEGPDDMPGHIRAALTATQVSVPVQAGRLALGTWQAVYVFEHRAGRFQRHLALHLLGE